MIQALRRATFEVSRERFDGKRRRRTTACLMLRLRLPSPNRGGTRLKVGAGGTCDARIDANGPVAPWPAPGEAKAVSRGLATALHTGARARRGRAPVRRLFTPSAGDGGLKIRLTGRQESRPSEAVEGRGPPCLPVLLPRRRSRGARPSTACGRAVPRPLPSHSRVRSWSGMKRGCASAPAGRVGHANAPARPASSTS